MLLIEGSEIKKQIEDRILIDIDLLQIYDHQRIGLVGKNGSGKTTLLKMIANENQVDDNPIQAYTSVKLVPQIKNSELEKSGGEITQAYLQAALNDNKGLLLLDEPTTHLDTERIEWLEKLLKRRKGAYVLVSHDRKFLDNICSEIWEIDDGKLKVYKGNYSDYAEQKALEINQQYQAYDNYMKEKQKIEAAMRLKEERAQRATKKPKNLSVKDARQKGMKPYFANKQKKLRKTVTAFKTKLDQLEKVDKPKEVADIKMDMINEADLKNKVIMRGERVQGSVNGRTLWQAFNFNIWSGDKIALIGANASGKTSLLNKIIHQAEGISRSPSVKIGYFSQHLIILEDDKTILENVQETSKQNETLIRTVLARMHFKDDDVYKKVSVLSGGEKVKVALTKIFVSDVNMLILDEPTNFLDIEALEALEDLLRNYQGTILFATHDRMLVERIANKIFHITNQKINIFDGNYQSYQESLKEKDKTGKDDELLRLETKISDVLSRLSLEPSEELEAEFQALLKKKKNIIG